MLPDPMAVPGTGQFSNSVAIAFSNLVSDVSFQFSTNLVDWLNFESDGPSFDGTGTLLLRARKDGYLPSRIITNQYSFVVAPTTAITNLISASNTVMVTLTNQTQEATLLYSINGNVFTSYVEPFILPYAAEIDVIASKSGYLNSTSSFVVPLASVGGRLLNLNFGGGNKVGKAAAGFGTNDFWNSIQSSTNVAATYTYSGGNPTVPIITWGFTTNLLWSDGLSSPVTVTVTNLSKTGSNGSSDGMFNSYLYENNYLVYDVDLVNLRTNVVSADSTVQIDNLPLGNYDIYIYGMGSNLGDDAGFSLTVGTNMPSAFKWTSQPGAVPSEWLEDESYVHFSNQFVAEGDSLRINLAPNFNYELLINGLQIIRNPLPTAPSPLITPKSGTYSLPDTGTGVLLVEISSLLDNATYFYSTVGPDGPWVPYSSSIPISTYSQIWAKTTKPGYADSDVSYREYQVVNYSLISSTQSNVSVPPELQEIFNHVDEGSFYGNIGPSLTIVSGNNQSGLAGTFLTQPLKVLVSDGAGRPLINAPVTFVIGTGGGGLCETTNTATRFSLQTMTGSDGIANIWWRLGKQLNSSNRTDVKIVTAQGEVKVAFSASSTAASNIPPAIVVTNLAGGVVSKPMVQIQGYCTKNLSNITYSVLSGSYQLTNQEALILKRYYDTNRNEIGRCDFQCFDVSLLEGTNTLMIVASDFDGNVCSTNLQVRFDPTLITQPPSVDIGWPTNSVRIGTTNVTVMGKTDDPTARVLVKVSNGSTTNTVEGIVERDGSYWIENVPLQTGTNQVSVMAINYSGLVTQSSITVSQSPTILFVRPGPALGFPSGKPNYDPYRDAIDVNTSCSNPTYSIWVNGLPASPGVAYQWATVPLQPGGTGVLFARAYPPGEEPSIALAGQGVNPPSPNCVDVVYEFDKPPVLRVSYYHCEEHSVNCRTFVKPYWDNANQWWYFNMPGTPPISYGTALQDLNGQLSGSTYRDLVKDFNYGDNISGYETHDFYILRDWVPAATDIMFTYSQDPRSECVVLGVSSSEFSPYLWNNDAFSVVNSHNSDPSIFNLPYYSLARYGSAMGITVENCHLTATGNDYGLGSAAEVYHRDAATMVQLVTNGKSIPKDSIPLTLRVGAYQNRGLLNIATSYGSIIPTYEYIHPEDLIPFDPSQIQVAGQSAQLALFPGLYKSYYELEEFADAYGFHLGVVEKNWPKGAVVDVTPTVTSAPINQITMDVYQPSLESNPVLAVDLNRDGVVSTEPEDKTTNVKPYVFWVNNDSDVSSNNTDPGSDEADNPDFTNLEIPSVRDLEDWTRLWISGLPPMPPGAGYSVTLSMFPVSGNPAVNIVDAIESDGGTKYLTDSKVAFQQVYPNPIGLCIKYTTINASTPLEIPISSLPQSGGNKYFLFEGAGFGIGRLVLTVKKDGLKVAQSVVWLDLRSVDDLYEIGSANNVTSGNPPSSLESGYDVVGTVSKPPLNEDSHVIVFVHGINNTESDFLNSSRTIFKRLYWAGYRGRFASFRWPCAYLPWNTPNPFKYNLGEFYAFKSATALKKYLSYLRNNRADLAGYSIDLYAHSQGNVVASEAIMQGAPFDNYILTQGAFPAHCYDTGAPFLQKLLDAETSSVNAMQTPFYAVNGGYHGYCSPIHGNLIDFYNTNDFALVSGVTAGIQTNWEENQRVHKPEAFLGGPSYIYDPSTHVTTGYYTFGSSYTVTDLQEIKALVARSRSAAVGAQNGLHGAISDSLDLKASFGFGKTRDEHSAQFARPIQTCLPYYQQLLTTYQILQ